jgi:hypothetical protein
MRAFVLVLVSTLKAEHHSSRDTKPLFPVISSWLRSVRRYSAIPYDPRLSPRHRPGCQGARTEPGIARVLWPHAL